MSTGVPESHKDLKNAQFASLATIGPDGRPQVSEVWFLCEGDDFMVSLNRARQKTKNLIINPAVCLFILDLANPMRYLEIRGDAAVEPDDDYAFADRVGRKYGGLDLRQLDGPGERRVKVTIHPSRINAINMGG
ncbi:MAG TPA: PPOX class F420-dependent oxidoreductase [Actinomycetota bacterium]|nr:PPOX class F420-dependent oxidoreductase [Actinomycetota bacterium]